MCENCIKTFLRSEMCFKTAPCYFSVLAAYLGDIALDEEDLRLLKLNYIDAALNTSESGQYGY